MHYILYTLVVDCREFHHNTVSKKEPTCISDATLLTNRSSFSTDHQTLLQGNQHRSVVCLQDILNSLYESLIIILFNTLHESGHWFLPTGLALAFLFFFFFAFEQSCIFCLLGFQSFGCFMIWCHVWVAYLLGGFLWSVINLAVGLHPHMWRTLLESIFCTAVAVQRASHPAALVLLHHAELRRALHMCGVEAVLLCFCDIMSKLRCAEK